MVWAVALLTTKLIPRRLNAGINSEGIRSLIGFGNLVGSLSHPVLYLLRVISDASPQAISERTSYHGV